MRDQRDRACMPVLQLQIETELRLAEWSQIVGRRAADEVDFEMIRRKIRRAFAFRKLGN